MIRYVLAFVIIIFIVSCSWFEELAGKNSDQFTFTNLNDSGEQVLSHSSQLVILIPDIQEYTRYSSRRRKLTELTKRVLHIFESDFNILLVLQVGDITDGNEESEYLAAKRSFSVFDGKIDYVLAVGNHDYGEGGNSKDRTTLYNDYFDESKMKTYVTSYEDGAYENSIYEFKIQGNEFYLVNLEFGPRDAVVEWASKYVNEMHGTGILLTHAFLDKNGERYDHEKYSYQTLSPYTFVSKDGSFGDGGVNDGQDLWKKLVMNNNIRLVLCGHRGGGAKSLISENNQGLPVLQNMFAIHEYPESIGGWIQILEFLEDSKTLRVHTYSLFDNIWSPSYIEFIYK